MSPLNFTIHGTVIQLLLLNNELTNPRESIKALCMINSHPIPYDTILSKKLVLFVCLSYSVIHFINNAKSRHHYICKNQ